MLDKLAVLGSGAIGSVIGAYLARGGLDITLIDMWPEHVEIMKRNGLKLSAVEGNFDTKVQALNLGELCTVKEQFDAVFLCVKSYDTAWSVKFIEPYLKPTAVIISAQNGMNDEQIASLIGYTRGIGCIITLGAGVYEPGHVLRTTAIDKPAFALGELNGMTTTRVQTLVKLMTHAGKSRITSNLWGERWSKLTTNSMSNPVAGLTGLGSAEIRVMDETATIAIKIARETIIVGRALGIEIEPVNSIPADLYEQAIEGESMQEVRTRLKDGAGSLREGKPSLLQDVLKGRRTEVDYLNGYVALKGHEVGIATPLNSAITKLIHQVEKGELKPEVSNLKYLEPYL